MRLSEAIELLESEGLLLERIKKYRTTPEERRFRDNRSFTDEWSLQERLHKIVEENGLDPYYNGTTIEKNLETVDGSVMECRVSFRHLDSDESDILKNIANSLKITNGGNDLKFVIPVKKRQSQWKTHASVMIGKALKDAFNVPPKVAYDELMRYDYIVIKDLYQAYKDEDIPEADSYIKEMYDNLEARIEKEEYGGIQNLTYQKFRDTVYDALDDYDSENNTDKFVTNQYGQDRLINKMFFDFTKLCRLFSKEIKRQRGPYRPQA